MLAWSDWRGGLRSLGAFGVDIPGTPSLFLLWRKAHASSTKNRVCCVFVCICVCVGLFVCDRFVSAPTAGPIDQRNAAGGTNVEAEEAKNVVS